MTKFQITKYEKKFAKAGENIPLLEELRKIKEGEYKSVILKCREFYKNGEKDKYDSLKNTLPGVTFSGVFNPTGRLLESLNTYNPFIIIDIDKLSPEDVSKDFEILTSDRYTFACWLSPSGFGIKGLVKINSTPQYHKAYFNKLMKYYKEKYNIELDKTTSDITRLCFSSFDEGLYFNTNSEIYEVSEEELKEEVPEVKKTNSSKLPSAKEISQNEKYLLFRTEGLNKSKDKDTVRKIIQFLKKRNKSITASYDQWLRVAFAISNTFSYDVGVKLYLGLCEMDKAIHNEFKSMELLRYCYLIKRDKKVSMGTIIYLAEKEGFNKP